MDLYVTLNKWIGILVKFWLNYFVHGTKSLFCAEFVESHNNKKINKKYDYNIHNFDYGLVLLVNIEVHYS